MPKELPLPLSTPSGRKWLDVVKKTRSHSRYASSYDMSKFKDQDVTAGYSLDTWVTTPRFTVVKAAHPQVIAIDCEMCETQDPVSGRKDPRALCRVSVVDVEKDEVLLDSLVKPVWPVTNYRTWVNGITAQNLENVQFTLRHAQAFMMALCTQETVILGHAVHNDLAALRIDHAVVGDSACLFAAADSETAQVALRDLAAHLLQTTMPEKHDSVNDARVAYQCLELYRTSQGQVAPIPRTPKPNNRCIDASQLFLHRIPKNVCDASQLSQMFLSHTHIQPVSVDDLIFADGTSGKTHVTFSSARHCNLAFDSIEGNGEVDPSGRLQKKVYLRNGDYIRVRKMAFERTKDERGTDATERRFSK
jgi:RNA exonuclease 1